MAYKTRSGKTVYEVRGDISKKKKGSGVLKVKKLIALHRRQQDSNLRPQRGTDF